jgi:hypothetical protein
VTATIDNSTDGVDELITIHSFIDPALELINVIPTSNIVTLQTLDPVKHPYYHRQEVSQSFFQVLSQ